MTPKFLVGAGLRSYARVPSADRPRTTVVFQRNVASAMAAAGSAEADDHRVPQRIKDRQTERYR